MQVLLSAYMVIQWFNIFQVLVEILLLYIVFILGLQFINRSVYIVIFAMYRMQIFSQLRCHYS